ncbi:hypothetical protein JXA32_17850 [Candidatus Sumerlaeota bacterium]|nr:hypothetical protein [Candidatus Sumerlaeota bacterium]
MECVDFVEGVLKDGRGERVRCAELHRSWHAHIDWCWGAGLHPVIFAPWGHGKTVQIVLGRTLYELSRDSALRVKVVCNSSGAARNRVQMLRYYVEYDENLHARCSALRKPGKRGAGRWAAMEFSVDDERALGRVDASVQGASILSTGIGGRADLIVFDDVVDRRNAIDQPKLRERVFENFFETWLSRLDGAAGRSVTIQTLWHREDLGHRLMGNAEFCVLKQAVSRALDGIECELLNAREGHPLLQGAVDGRFVLPLWAERWGREALKRKKRENVRAFERGFQQRAYTREETMFPSFRKCLVDLRREELF